jgi:hypothetical protein
MSEQYEDDEFEYQPRRRLRGPLMVVLLMVLFAGGLWFVYSAGKSKGPAEVPLLRADETANKKRPDQPGGMKIPDQDKCIYDPSKCSDSGKGAQTEKLLPPPEMPLAAPVAPPPPPEETAVAPAPAPEPPPAIVQAPAVPQPSPATSPAAQPPVRVQLEPPPPVTAKPQAQPRPAPAKPPPVAAAGPQAPPPAPAAPQPAKPSPAPVSVGAGSGYLLQIGAVRSEAAAQQEWDRLKRTQKDLLGGMGAGWSRASLGDRGTFYRILAGPISDPATAERICGELKKRSVGCILVRP